METALKFRKSNRSAYLNFLRAKYEAYTGTVQVASRPYYLCLDPSDICQLRCPTCPTGMENESRHSMTGRKVVYRDTRSILSGDLFDSVLEELGQELFLIMFYNYGEPLLNKRLPEFVRKAHALDIETEVHTNLSLPLSDSQIDQLLSSGLDSLNASVDGFSQEKYEIHRVGGDVELVKRNLERLAVARQRLGVNTRITYKFLVFSFNEDEVPEAQRFCDERGIHFVRGDAFIHDPEWLPSYRKSEEPYYSADERERLLAEWEAAGKGAYWDKSDNRPFWSVFPKQAETNLPGFCAWHYGFSVITGGGPVAPCCAAAKQEDDFGRVIPQAVRFSDVWNNDNYQKSRASFAGKSAPESNHADPVCVRCYFPRFVHHLYSVHDSRVVSQFKEVFGDTDPFLEKAFALLNLADERDNSKFVNFVENNVQRLNGEHLPQ